MMAISTGTHANRFICEQTMIDCDFQSETSKLSSDYREATLLLVFAFSVYRVCLPYQKTTYTSILSRNFSEAKIISYTEFNAIDRRGLSSARSSDIFKTRACSTRDDR